MENIKKRQISAQEMSLLQATRFPELSGRVKVSQLWESCQDRAVVKGKAVTPEWFQHTDWFKRDKPQSVRLVVNTKTKFPTKKASIVRVRLSHTEHLILHKTTLS